MRPARIGITRPAPPAYPDDWRHGIVDWCDGGYSSWSAVYDPIRAAFLQLRFNGLA